LAEASIALQSSIEPFLHLGGSKQETYFISAVAGFGTIWDSLQRAASSRISILPADPSSVLGLGACIVHLPRTQPVIRSLAFHPRFFTTTWSYWCA
jgi:hypothetical protein